MTPQPSGKTKEDEDKMRSIYRKHNGFWLESNLFEAMTEYADLNVKEALESNKSDEHPDTLPTNTLSDDIDLINSAIKSFTTNSIRRQKWAIKDFNRVVEQRDQFKEIAGELGSILQKITDHSIGDYAIWAGEGRDYEVDQTTWLEDKIKEAEETLSKYNKLIGK